MRRHLLPFVTRHEPRAASGLALKSGIGAILGMSLVGGLATLTGLPLLIAPFGATAVLLFAVPASPLAQPMNVVGGYAIAIAAATAAAIWFPGMWWAAGIAVGLAIAAMLAFRLTHPPAGAIPLLTLTSAMPLETLAFSTVLGSVSLVAVAALHHRLPPKQEYPKRP
ncbi:HPP family protein [Stappia sp. F7233]|uniref:HPP family protein n=1 Tax=Stappia albiluteola TaxID=2758565 RepID=A0A839AFT6_9HYPH|nr:HPP family protein [Stappia albiluteola]MBA5777888.1 HPP family protein [Stappia albiluteola]